MQPGKISTLIFGLGLGLIAVLGYLDFLTGDYSLDPFYLAAIFIVTWFVGIFCGMICVVEAVMAEAVSDFYVHGGEVFNPFHYWNWGSDLIVFSVFCLLVGMIRRFMEERH